MLPSGLLDHLFWTAAGQFANPHGFGGQLAGWVMANRRSNKERNRWTVERLALQANHRVLEIGCGPGLALVEAARRATRGEVVGVDSSPVMIGHARRRLRRAGLLDRVRLVEAPVGWLPSFAERFDRVIAINTIRFWPDPPARLRELRRLMKPGAMIAITEQPRRRGARNADTEAAALRIQADLKVAGFAVDSPSYLPSKPVSAVCVTARA